MKKFIVKTSIFIIPFVSLYFVLALFYSGSETPDLIRLGYLPNIYKNYRSAFEDVAQRKIKFLEFSANKTSSAKYFTIGDSFSAQGNYGYNSFLADDNTVVNLDRYISQNQIQTLYGLLNGDFFENRKFEYIILENIERHFVENIQYLKDTIKITTLQLDSLIDRHKPAKERNELKFFSEHTLEFPFSMIRYYFQKNYLSNGKVYNVEASDKDLFSNNSGKILFYNVDVENLKFNNDSNKVRQLNDVLNDLSFKIDQKGMKLIVIPAPDKYDLYFDFIKSKEDFEKPLFFTYLNSLEKKYLCVNSKKILSEQLKVKKDIYFYDDTHWSPIAAKIISEEIKKLSAIK